jgi:hypothetical protein
VIVGSVRFPPRSGCFRAETVILPSFGGPALGASRLVSRDRDAVADELYSLPRDEFTAARNDAATRARKDGDRDLAEQIGALRRPTTAAWLVNQLAREHPDEVRALVELGDGLRAAQDRLEGDELRRLSQQRGELVHGLVQQTKALARSAGQPASDAVTRQLEDTFTAAVNSSAAAQSVADGRLTAALDPADTAGGLTAGAAAPAQAPKSRPKPDGATRRDRDERQRRERDERLRRDLERACADADEADTALDEAQRGLTDAEQAVDDAGATLQELRERIEAAERDEQDARRRARSTQRHVDAADRTAREARQRVRDLEHRLSAGS